MKDYRNKKECGNCHKEILRATRKCPFCEKHCYPHLFIMNSPNKKRNKEMVRMLKTGEFTLKQVGEKYNISRERVRQLYRAVTKKPYTTIVVKRKKAKKRAEIVEKEIQGNKIRFYCRDCNRPVLFSENHPINKSCARNVTKYIK